MKTPPPQLGRRVRWEEWVRAAGRIRGEHWDRWAERHGDWRRDGVMHGAVREGGLPLTEVVRQVGLKYQAAAQAVNRFGEALAADPERKRFVSKLRREVPTVWHATP